MSLHILILNRKPSAVFYPLGKGNMWIHSRTVLLCLLLQLWLSPVESCQVSDKRHREECLPCSVDGVSKREVFNEVQPQM